MTAKVTATTTCVRYNNWQTDMNCVHLVTLSAVKLLNKVYDNINGILHHSGDDDKCLQFFTLHLPYRIHQSTTYHLEHVS